MNWRIWRAIERTLNGVAFCVALPAVPFVWGAHMVYLLADICQRRKWAARSRTVKPIHDPTFVRATRIE